MITLQLTEEEQKVFLQLLDAALKFHGMGAIDAVGHFRGKMIQAQTPLDVAPAEA